jgi:hypothetical protein
MQSQCIRAYNLNCIPRFQANLAIQQVRLGVAEGDLNKAQAQLDEKQAELDEAQGMYDKAVQEKQVILLLEQLPKQTIVI